MFFVFFTISVYKGRIVGLMEASTSETFLTESVMALEGLADRVIKSTKASGELDSEKAKAE